MAEMTDRLPPYNLELEQDVLGAILFDPDVLDDVAEELDPDDFFRDSHQVIYRAILDLSRGPGAVDRDLLRERLLARDEIDRAGGDDYLAEMMVRMPVTYHAREYARIIHQKALTRRVIAACHDLLRDGYSNLVAAHELVGRAIDRMMDIEAARKWPGMRPIVESEAAVLAEILAIQRGEFVGLPTGLVDLDRLLGGLRPGQLVVVAARPSVGKTTLGLNLAWHAAAECGVPVYFASLEMDQDSLYKRLLLARAGVDGAAAARRGGLLRDDHDRIVHTADAIRAAFEGRFYLDDRSRSAAAIHAEARRLGGLGLAVVDYLQLVAPADEDLRANRQEQVANLSRRFKELAAVLKVPLVLLAQLNREVEKRADKRPVLADLRESGAIENDADSVVLIHREDYYAPEKNPGLAELIVAKNRNGPTGSVEVTYLRSRFQFVNKSPELGSPPY
jgi:replicative DNA helicase